MGRSGWRSRKTFTFNITFTSWENNWRLGLSVISDKIGPVEETNAYVDVSYTNPVGMETRDLHLVLKVDLLFMI